MNAKELKFLKTIFENAIPKSVVGNIHKYYLFFMFLCSFDFWTGEMETLIMVSKWTQMIPNGPLPPTHLPRQQKSPARGQTN